MTGRISRFADTSAAGGGWLLIVVEGEGRPTHGGYLSPKGQTVMAGVLTFTRLHPGLG
jgi:hypothetical protein